MDPTDRPEDALRIVTVNSHQAYLHLLGGLPHRFTVVDHGLPAAPCPWDPRVRPLPRAWRTASLSEAGLFGRNRPFDVGLAHNVTDLLALRELCDRLVLLVHCSLAGRIAYEGSRVPPREFAALVARYLAAVPAELVFVSELKRRSWAGLDGAVIDHGIPADAYRDWTGEQPLVLRVANLQKRREVLLHHALQQEALRGIPNRLVGVNPELAGAEPASDWDDLRRAYREARCFLVTNHPVLEDGYNLATLEAMATGMPVVTTPHPTSPVRHGWEGLVAEDAAGLRAHVSRLLLDRDYAARLGAQARLTALRQFPYAPFLAAWDRLLRRVATAPRDYSPIATATPGKPILSDPPRSSVDRQAPRLQVIRGGRPEARGHASRSPRPAGATLRTVVPVLTDPPEDDGPSTRGDGERRP